MRNRRLDFVFVRSSRPVFDTDPSKTVSVAGCEVTVWRCRQTGWPGLQRMQNREPLPYPFPGLARRTAFTIRRAWPESGTDLSIISRARPCLPGGVPPWSRVITPINVVIGKFPPFGPSTRTAGDAASGPGISAVMISPASTLFSDQSSTRQIRLNHQLKQGDPGAPAGRSRPRSRILSLATR